MTRLRSQSGVTLIELIVAMTIATMTVLAVFAILDTSIKQSTEVAGRVNATQRARIAMDTITRQLRSQVCYSAIVPAIVSGTDDAVKFHVDLSDGSTADRAARDRLRCDGEDAVTERTWAGTGSPLAFPTVTRTRQLVTDIFRSQDKDGNVIPIFRYYAYNTAVPPRPDLRLTTPLSTVDRAQVARIDVGFLALPPGTQGRRLPRAPCRFRTRSTSASRTPTTQHPLPHAPDP